MSEGVLPLSSELPTVSEESPGGEQATTPAKMSDKELHIRSFFIMNTPEDTRKSDAQAFLEAWAQSVGHKS